MMNIRDVLVTHIENVALQYFISFFFFFFFFFLLKGNCLFTGIKSMQVQTKIKKKRNKKREEDDEKPRATTVCMHASLPQKKQQS